LIEILFTFIFSVCVILVINFCRNSTKLKDRKMLEAEITNDFKEEFGDLSIPDETLLDWVESSRRDDSGELNILEK